jgi:UDP-N-acetylmuramoyl-tripeptide--D-alanyl-D-alanine ligase
MATPIPTNTASSELARVAQLTRGTLTQPGSGVSSVEIDSRRVRSGSLFVAIRGERIDAHDHLDEAVANGAAAVLVERDVSVRSGVGVVRVASTLDALGALASDHLSRCAASKLRVGITGSVGKTSTKELVAGVLHALGRAPHVSPGNLNNLVGLPMSMLAVDPVAHGAVVLEMGMSVPGEIAKLAAIAAPTYGIVTAVAEVHTEGVGSLAGVAAEKGALLRALPANGVAIHPIDDVALAPHVEASPAKRKLGFGVHEGAAVRLVSTTTRTFGQTAVYRIPEADSEYVVDLRLVGHGAARNAAAAIALAFALDGEPGVRRALPALEAAAPEPGRLRTLPGIDKTTLLDDAYNASPRAVLNALEAASALARSTQGRLIVVLGDMLELGALEEEMHQRVGEAVALVGTSLFVACGLRMRIAAEEAREMGTDLVLELDDPMDAAAHVRGYVAEDDVILVKGSRGMRMERVVEALTAKEPTAEEVGS